MLKRGVKNFFPPTGGIINFDQENQESISLSYPNIFQVGKNVTDIKVGQKVGVGIVVDCCLDCSACKDNQECYCEKQFTMTYNFPTTFGRIKTDRGYTLGGYSGKMTVNRKFLIVIPEEYPLEYAGPIFCAGITTYSPLVHWGARNGGKKVGVIGIGGLGSFGIQFAKAMGNEVTAISISPKKEGRAKELGADNFVVSSDEKSMAAAASSLDLILNTVSANHQCATYMPLLKTDGIQVLLGATMEPHQVS